MVGWVSWTGIVFRYSQLGDDVFETLPSNMYWNGEPIAGNHGGDSGKRHLWIFIDRTWISYGLISTSTLHQSELKPLRKPAFSRTILNSLTGGTVLPVARFPHFPLDLSITKIRIRFSNSEAVSHLTNTMPILNLCRLCFVYWLHMFIT